MRTLIFIAGACLLTAGAAVYWTDVKTAICSAMAIVGLGLMYDAVRK
jgi:hypothetical protein